jgi:flagellar basal-body rod modification protein FlgD
MSTVVPTSAASTTGTSANGTTLTNPSAQLGDNTFLQLMVTQLQDQDPLNPTDTSNYLSQLAQFTSLEQETNTATATKQLETQNESSEALSLLGKTVTYTDSSGKAQTGAVASIDLTGTSPTLTIGTTSGISPTAVSTVS